MNMILSIFVALIIHDVIKYFSKCLMIVIRTTGSEKLPSEWHESRELHFRCLFVQLNFQKRDESGEYVFSNKIFRFQIGKLFKKIEVIDYTKDNKYDDGL